MKKHIVALTAIAALSVGTANQAFASSVHTVQSGDTLWAISQANNVSVTELQTWNDLDSTLIYPAQQLKVEDSVKVHIVIKGDTLSSIAENYGLSVNEIKKNNNLSSDLIITGEELVLEGSKVDSAHTTVQSEPEVAKTQAPETAKTTTKAAPAPAKESEPVVAPTSSATKEMTVTATAYTAFCEGCSGVTSTGIDLRSNPNQKVIAVDPTVIPLGSRVWVEGYGEAIAGDVGSAIKGNIIDVFIPEQDDALNWGRQTVQIKILD
ncbi:LysM peptidoglycan-binding and 3D domain-containing protein [Paenisporosarcina indica]|uniref:LysM peptidoglycan-binding and 3D domain-containing protein n=1 Tax=Paenisporosarcina indica TaxID=650093 RepID=UPI00095031BC|nr:3D domain-containing protein [Paenisporosarcina indica]